LWGLRPGSPKRTPARSTALPNTNGRHQRPSWSSGRLQSMLSVERSPDPSQRDDARRSISLGQGPCTGGVDRLRSLP
jgi:hypothetical protein